MSASLSEQNAVWPKDRVVEVSDGARVAYTVRNEAGTRVPVVFMNGWTCPDAYWKDIAPAIIDRGHPTVFFDTRGHGQSRLPGDAIRRAPKDIPRDEVSVKRVATDIVEIIEDAGLGRAVLVGHSMGVQGIFEAYRVGGPEKVTGLVPVAGTYENPVPTFMEKEVLDRLFPIADVLFGGIPFHALHPVMAQAHRMPKPVAMKIIRTLVRTGDNVRYEDVERHVRMFSEVDFGIMWRMMSGLRHHSAADVLPTIEVPVLILAGERDHFTPRSVQERMRLLTPTSELVLFPQGGHLLPVEESAAVTDAMIDWLSRHFR